MQIDKDSQQEQRVNYKIDEQTIQLCQRNMQKILIVLKDKFNDPRVQMRFMTITKLIASYLYYQHYCNQNWQKHKKYLIYQKYPQLSMIKQYLQVLIKNSITNEKNIQDYKKYFQQNLMIYFQEQKNKKQCQKNSIGIILHPANLKTNFLIIENNQIAYHYFQELKKKTLKQFIKALEKLYKTSSKAYQMLEKAYQEIKMITLLKGYKLEHDQFDKNYLKFKNYCKNKQNCLSAKAQIIYEQYLSQDKEYQNKIPKLRRRGEKTIHDLQKYYIKLFKFLFSDHSHIANQYKFKLTYGFPKGSNLWFQSQEKTCKRQCFQQTKIDIFDYQITKMFQFPFYKNNKKYVFYYLDKECQHIDQNYYKQINSYEVISARSLSLFNLSIENIVKKCEQLKWDKTQCKDYIDKNKNEQLQFVENAKQTIYYFLNQTCKKLNAK